jgi:hypothetical protein
MQPLAANAVKADAVVLQKALLFIIVLKAPRLAVIGVEFP